MLTRRKLWVLLLLAGALVALVVLSAGIAGLDMPTGTPFSLATNGGKARFEAPVELSDGQFSTLVRLIRVGMIVMIALLPFSVIYLLLSPEARRRLLPNLVLFAVLLVLARIISRDLAGSRELDLAGGLGGMAAEDMAALPPPSQFNGEVPPWLTAFTSLILAAFVVLLVGLLAWTFYRRRTTPPATALLDQIAEEAEDALATLHAGGDLRSAIIRAYREMNRVVLDARGVARRQDMTAREFEQQLALVGLPDQPVRDLTRLFEEVRYGAKDLGPWEERRAITCLTAIVEACVRDEGRKTKDESQAAQAS